MLHVMTVHFRSAVWIDAQLEYLRRNCRATFQTWAILDGIDTEWVTKFDQVIEFDGTHPQRLNELARRVLAVADPKDDLLFLDGDAFPIAPIDDLLCSLPGAPDLVAVRRDENLGDLQPHPCFCLTTAGYWKQIEGDWRVGHQWINSAGDEVTDVGGNLLGILQRNSGEWRPLTRRNTVDLHPLWFGVYGDAQSGPVVYHHGAGFRPRIARVDGAPAPRRPRFAKIPKLRVWESRFIAKWDARRRNDWLAKAGPTQLDMASTVFAALETDPEFYRQFFTDC